MSGIYSSIYKNDNSFVNCGCSNQDGYYTPREIRSFNGIPENIAFKVKAYLKDRVGIELAIDFELVDGQIIEIDEFEKYFSGSTRKTAYYLGLSYN